MTESPVATLAGFPTIAPGPARTIVFTGGRLRGSANAAPTWLAPARSVTLSDPASKLGDVARAKKRQARKPRVARPERKLDARLVAARLAADRDVARAGDWILAVSQARLPDGRILSWCSPQPVAFNLLEAHRLARKGSHARRRLLAQREARPDGTYGPPVPQATTDCVRDLQGAVFHAFASIESFANHVVDMLEPSVEVTDGRKSFKARRSLACPWTSSSRRSSR
jgi:hypothetical protein